MIPLILWDRVETKVSWLGFNGGWWCDFRLAFGSTSTLLSLGFFHVKVTLPDHIK